MSHDYHDLEAVKAANVAKLGHMAGQIADYFKSYPEAEAVPAIADHINQFWSRRMREDFLATYGVDNPELSPLVRKALSLVRPASPKL